MHDKKGQWKPKYGANFYFSQVESIDYICHLFGLNIFMPTTKVIEKK